MALAVMAASSNKPASASKVKKAPQKMDSKKAFEIPGLQARPYHDDELQVAFEIIDLDRHGEIGATDLRRALQLCGEPEPTDAEIQEMIRLMDPDGSGSIEFAEFRRYFVEPPPLFRNFDLHRRGGFGEAPDEEEEEEPPPPDTLALVDGGDATPALARLESRKKKFTLKEHAEGDPRAPYVKELAKHGITPEFIRDVYQTFVEIDTKDTGFMSFEAFCKVFSKKPSPEMREIFDAFDADREGELDLRQFVIGLSTKVNDILQMRATLKCHQELQKLGQLYEYQPSFLTIFVSHQWLGGRHPDPSGSQFRNLQKALRKVIDGSLKLELDMTSQFLGHQKTLTQEDRRRLQEAYVWFDWFSVPQASFEHDPEVKEEVRRTADLCIRSIPAYVDACQMFVALVPSLLNEKKENLNYFTWLSRGWCRAEMWCKLMSEKSDFPIIVVSATDQAEFIMPVQWLNCPVHAGTFSVAHDRQEVCKFIQAALDFKLERLSCRKNLNLFRYYAAMYESFLGLPRRSRSLEEFLSYFRFSSLEESFRRKGMGAMACAVLSADVSLVRHLVALKAPLDVPLPAIVEVDILPDWTPLHLATAHSSNSIESLAALLELRGDPNASNRLGHPLLGICDTAEAVELLVEKRADVNKLSPPTMASPLVLACLRCAPPEVFESFIKLKADVNLVQGGLGLSPLHSLAINARVNSHTLSVAQLLVEAKANPDLPCRAGALFRGVELFARLYMRMQKDPPGLIWVFGEGSTTPLGYAAMPLGFQYFGSDGGNSVLGVSEACSMMLGLFEASDECWSHGSWVLCHMNSYDI
ncbi:Squidulin (Optic lobe calcium-binding protein) (SCABP) [Durusdinium trenchii]|uniref:Squidulin (Optic lobe calcium-binding protein) (SCABP) n=1 Tax=Durusdinium trenchii TaxID=1381693 RepID=A0ABP0PKB9_9DINO